MPNEKQNTRNAEIVTSSGWWSWAWITPLLAIAIAGWLVYTSIPEWGPTITLYGDRGDGIESERTLVKHRGVVVGNVKKVALTDSLERVEVEVRLRSGQEAFTRGGATFWVVRPELHIDEVRGLQTIVTGPYIEARPGSGKVASEFEMLDAPPLAGVGPEDLDVILLAAHSRSVKQGTAITYRGLQIGIVKSMVLAGDSTNVEMEAVIYRRYAPLVRDNSIFWISGGLDLEFDLLSGAEIKGDSLKSLISGGISMVTPTAYGPPATDGKRFILEEEAEEDWERWAPPIALSGESAEGDAESSEISSTATAEVEPAEDEPALSRKASERR